MSWAPLEPIKVWNLDTRQKTREIAISNDELGKNAINGAFSANGAVFAANSGMRVRVYDTRSGFIRQLIRLNGPARYVMLSNDGSQLLVVGDNRAFLYQVASKEDPLQLPIPDGFPGPNRSLFAADGQSLVLLNPELSSWKLLKNSQPSAGTTGFSPDYAVASVFPEQASQSLSLMLDGTLQVLDRSGVPQRSIRLGEGTLWAAAISADGSRLATSGKQKGVALWSADGKWISTLSQPLANALAFSGTDLLAGAMPDNKVVLWQLPAGKVKQVIKLDAPPQQVALSSDGKALAVRVLGVVSLWDLSGSAPRQTGKYDGSGMALSADGSLLAVSQSNLDGHSIRIYHPDSSDPVSVLNTAGQWMSFSADDSLLAVGGDPLTLWRVNEGIQALQLATNGVMGTPFFIDQGRLLVLVGWDGSQRLWGVP